MKSVNSKSKFQISNFKPLTKRTLKPNNQKLRARGPQPKTENLKRRTQVVSSKPMRSRFSPASYYLLRPMSYVLPFTMLSA
jgi:hypothetical protein